MIYFSSRMRELTLFVCLILWSPAIAQHTHSTTSTHFNHPSCGFDPIVDQLKRTDPAVREELERYLQQGIPALSKRVADRSGSAPILNVPIVVHIIHNGEPIGQGQNLSLERIQAQINVLNEDFSAQNADYDLTPARWSSLRGNPEMNFCLAKVDPDGQPTTGIVRHQLTVTGTSASDQNIEDEIKPAIAWDASRYYNIYVLPIPGTTANGGTTGYAYLPYNGTIGNNQYDGSVVDYRWFGGPGFGQSGYTTLTHETGHYLGLFHTFNGESCTDDDGINDTPNVDAPTSASGWFSCNSGYPTGPSSCGNEHLYVNYMDYASGSCLTSFTQGQVNVMRAVLDGTAGSIGFGSRNALLTNANTICTFFANDAAITEILYPGQRECGRPATIEPVVTLFNAGSDDLFSVQINYQVDAAAVESISYTTNLAPGASEEVTLSTVSVPNGDYQFRVFTSLPNGVADEEPSNDEQQVNVQASVSQQLPLAEDFEQVPYPNDTTRVWRFNVSDDDYAWEQFTGASAYGDGQSCMMLDNYDVGSDILNTLDALISPVYSFTDVQGAQLTFDVAYARYQDATSSYGDSLLVYVSNNCGARYEQIIYRDGGATLETASPTNMAFTPENDEWKTIALDLSAYDQTDNLSIAIVNKSGWGNRMFIDNFNISTATTTCSNFSIQTQSVDVSCAEGTDGKAWVSVTGGTAPYTYQWSMGSTLDSVQNLTAGTYSVVVTDQDNCVREMSVTINQPAAIELQFSSQPASGSGVADGSASVSVSGGTSPYSYLWSNGATTQQLQNIASGNYALTVTDQKKCTAEGSVDIETNEPDCADLQLESEVKSVSCQGLSDGRISLNPSGGDGNYSYDWSTGASSATLSDLSPGTYSLTLTDGQNCQLLRSFEVSEPDALSVRLSATPESRRGSNNGSIEAVISGGTIPYNISWNNGSDKRSQNALPPGQYRITVTDGNGCEQTAESMVEAGKVDCSDFALTIEKTSPACGGEVNGSIQLIANGGIAPYKIRWPDGSNQAERGQLTAGQYPVTITDAVGCTIEQLIELTEPAPLEIELIETDGRCGGTGKLEAIVSGGSAPYHLLWSNGIETAKNTNLASGTYQLTVTDANNCSTTAAASISTEARGLEIGVERSNPTCHGLADGSLELQVNFGEAPYTIRWSTGGEGDRIEGLTAGSYGLQVTDGRGCNFVSNYQLTEPTELTLEFQVQSATSSGGGQIIAEPGGGVTPYQYRWSTGATGPVLTNVTAGTYKLTLTDANGCTKISSVSVDINTSTKQIESLTSFRLFPNPATADFLVLMEFSEQETLEVSLIDASGRSVYYSQHQGRRLTLDIPVRDLPPGIYRLMVSSQMGVISRNVAVLKP